LSLPVTSHYFAIIYEHTTHAETNLDRERESQLCDAKHHGTTEGAG
jgi:hypothetical protein